jgi:hypothetical protein
MWKFDPCPGRGVAFCCQKKIRQQGRHRGAIQPDTGEIEVFQFKEVVLEVTEPDLQISLEEGRKLDPDCEVGDSLGTKMDTSTSAGLRRNPPSRSSSRN